MLKKLKYILLAIAMFFLAGNVTIPKLYKMFQIRGVIKGAIIDQYIITSKWTSPGKKGSVFYNVSWSQDTSHITPANQENIEKEKWDILKIGDTIEIAGFENDEHTYVKNSIYDSTGNFIFDFFLLGVEILGLLYCILMLKPEKSHKT